MSQLIGTLLSDRYRITALLGRQTGRRTFLATDLQSHSAVVVKLLLFGPDFEWDDLKLFEREAAVLQALDHPSIPTYLDYFETETELGRGSALVQNYFKAQSLQAWVQSGRTFSEADLKAIAIDLLNILDYLHHRHPAVIHRDIKPSNILLGDRSGNSPGQLCLVDFGSVQTAIHGGTRTIVGTYGYMPPEQFGGQTTPASDLYALGATLIFLATGQHPDQLPQDALRIQFTDRVNLSQSWIDYIKHLTEPSLTNRLTSVSQAMDELNHPPAPNLVVEESLLTIATQPFGSQVQLIRTEQTLEIVIPSTGFQGTLIPIIAFAVSWNSFMVFWYGNAIMMGTAGLFMAVFAIPHLYAGMTMIWGIAFTIFGRLQLQITPDKISQSSTMLGFTCSRPTHLDRQHLTKLEYTQLSSQKDSEGTSTIIPRQINIWAGVNKIELGQAQRLLPQEVDWLAEELSQWLDLPIA